jgi:Uma2 family endonuclease
MSGGGAMVAKATAEPWPAAGQVFTVDDLDGMPDDGRRYELVDGVLIVSPHPSVTHQAVLSELAVQLHEACPPGLFVGPAPGMRMSADTELIPDIVVIRQDQLAGRRVTRPPLLAVEIESPSSALFDPNTKKAVYERFSIESYWIVVPGVDLPELIAFELREGRYEQVANVTNDGSFRARQPFDIEVVPSRLVADLLPGS